MKTFKKLIIEGNKDEVTKSMLRSADNKLVNEVRDRYYGVSDHINGMVESLNSLNGETGEFGADLTAAKKMLKLFDKMSIGRFL
jgi:Mg2+ and Co2+ transporter CorA